MAFLTESQLRLAGSTIRKSANTYTRDSALMTVFLSHSHKDRELAQGLVAELAKLGVALYVDWNDSSMSEVTDRTTADRIKNRIREDRWFMLLATNNAIASKWVPWEVGIADVTKGDRRMLVIPVIDPSGRFEGSEYLQLYPRIERSTIGALEVFNPGSTYSGVLLERHLRSVP